MPNTWSMLYQEILNNMTLVAGLPTKTGRRGDGNPAPNRYGPKGVFIGHIKSESLAICKEPWRNPPMYIYIYLYIFIIYIYIYIYIYVISMYYM